MKVLVISDIHANLTALESVLSAAGDFTSTWCLGDLVGYGPDPNECIELVASLPKLTCILGNHDAATLKLIDVGSFNPEARAGILWTQEKLNSANAEFLRKLPERAVLDQFTLVHGSPRQPIWEYLLDTSTATYNFDHFETAFCFVGHTHLPVIYHLADEARYARLIVPDNSTQLTLAPRAIINPGSVGQPRDRDPRAAYSILDLELYTWECHRVEYDINAVQERMRTADLPERHIVRLSAGW